MRKIQKSSELLWIFGIVFVALGVAICSKANLGVSMIAAPAFIISEYISKINSIFSVGVTEYVFQGTILIILCLVVRKFNWKYLLAFGCAVIYGYALDFFMFLLGTNAFDTIYIRWIMLIVGDISVSFGVACFFRTYMPLQVYELFVAEVSSVFKLNINKTKWCFDISLLVISVSLALILFGDISSFDWSTIGYSNFHSIGLGTLITTAINSPIIALCGKLIDKTFEQSPRIKKLESIIKR